MENDSLITNINSGPEEQIEFSSRIRNIAINSLETTINDNRNKNEPTGIIVLKILSLKEINSTLGFKKGDDFLLQCLSRIRQALLPEDNIYRISENELLLCLAKIINVGHIVLAAHKLEKVFKQPFSLGKEELSAKIRMGIAIYPDHANSAEELLKNALAALESAINQKSLYSIWPVDHRHTSQPNIILETELKNAIYENSFDINYQPKLDIKNKKIIGIECLARWKSPNYGQLQPEYFIEIAENAGLIDDLTLNIVNLALRESKDWADINHDLTLSINLSAINLQDKNFVEMIKRAINIWDANPEKIIFEVTESAMMLNPELSLNILMQLNNIGVRCSIDDFGTGYSSFAYLKKLPVSELKIDKSFVLNMVTDKEDAIIAGAIVELAHSFDMFVTAEGVEKPEILHKLAEMNCEYAQGYYIASPMSNTKFKQWIDNYHIDY